ncbi:MAG: NAD(P)/FAD-dependent oxidoreductase, partial [Brevundimonas sp.]
MADLSTDIVVIGAGILGLAVAVELTARGRDVCVVDLGDPNASSVAAGMIAPAFESVLEGADAARAELLRAAGGLWPSFARSHGLTLDHRPAEWRGPDPDSMATRLGDLGFRFELRAGTVAALDDLRIDPTDAMARLSDLPAARGIRARAQAIERVDQGWTVLTERGSIFASQVVVATGVGAPVKGLSQPATRAVRTVRPIAGQIGVVAQTLTDRVLRGPGGYVVPAGQGALIGATMVEGQMPALIDPSASARL